MTEPQDPANTGDEPKPSDSAPEAGTGGQSESPNHDALAARLRRAEKALEAERAKTAAFEADQQKRAEAEMSELDRQKARADAAEAKLTEALATQKESAKRNAFRFAVDKLGATNSDDVLQLADLSSLDFDGEKVTGVDELAKQMRKAKPYLFAGTAPARAGTGGGNPPGGPPEVTPEQIRRMTPEQLQAYRASLQA